MVFSCTPSEIVISAVPEAIPLTVTVMPSELMNASAVFLSELTALTTFLFALMLRVCPISTSVLSAVTSSVLLSAVSSGVVERFILTLIMSFSWPSRPSLHIFLTSIEVFGLSHVLVTTICGVSSPSARAASVNPLLSSEYVGFQFSGGSASVTRYFEPTSRSFQVYSHFPSCGSVISFTSTHLPVLSSFWSMSFTLSG